MGDEDGRVGGHGAYPLPTHKKYIDIWNNSQGKNNRKTGIRPSYT